eukprot:3297205-Rhodomonas_salina.1
MSGTYTERMRMLRCVPYEMSGNRIAYAYLPARALRDFRYLHSVCISFYACPMRLCVPYAMSSTDMAY